MLHDEENPGVRGIRNSKTHTGFIHDPDYIYQECPEDDEQKVQEVVRHCTICGKKLAQLNKTDTCFCHPVRFNEKGNADKEDVPVDAKPEKKGSKEGKKIEGRPCYRCGGTLRYASNHNCVACERDRVKRLWAERKKK